MSRDKNPAPLSVQSVLLFLFFNPQSLHQLSAVDNPYLTGLQGSHGMNGKEDVFYKVKSSI